jgi:hypothetical protein
LPFSTHQLAHRRPTTMHYFNAIPNETGNASPAYERRWAEKHDRN